MSRFSQATPKKAAKAAVKAAAPAASKTDKFTHDLVADLDVSPEDDKLNTDFNKIMDMERFKQRSAHSHRHHSRQDLFPNIDSFAHKSVQQGLIDTENEHNRVYKKQKHNASNNFSSKNPNYFSIDERRRKFRFAKATPKK